jgi:hypothetical protein
MDPITGAELGNAMLHVAFDLDNNMVIVAIGEDGPDSDLKTPEEVLSSPPSSPAPKDVAAWGVQRVFILTTNEWLTYMTILERAFRKMLLPAKGDD